MDLPDQTADLLLVVAVSLSGILALLVAFLFVRLRRVTRTTRDALGNGATNDVFEALASLQDGHERLRNDLGIVHGNTEHVRDLLREATTRVAIVRYDAFDDMGGGLSFSAAFLTERGSGVVVSAINGRQETRVYAKPVVEGDSEFSLSAEEIAAVDQAMKGVLTTGAALDDPDRRRRRRAS